MTITFHGAAGEVTGSKHLIQTGPSRILLDCGMFQGGRRENWPRNGSFAFDSSTIDAVVLSHAHLDHVGLLPRLVAGGFQGRIYSTGATRDLTELILLDSAKLQEQDAEFAQRHRFASEQTEPLYRTDDIPGVMERFEHLNYSFLGGDWQTIAPDVRVKFYDAGHILGSAVTVIETKESDGIKRLVYTGDLGRTNAPLLRDPDRITESAETLIMESTYGGRQHHHVGEAEDTIVRHITTVIERKSRLIVPAFSLGRTQELIYLIHRLTDQGRLPRIPIVIDSPLAQRITDVYSQHQRNYDRETSRDFARPGENPLTFSNLEFTQSVDESKALNTRPGPLVIISASGMASGGRVVHHLRNNLADPNVIILFTGYQARHTLGRQIVNGSPDVKIFGQHIPVKAQIATANDLSAHADVNELSAFAGQIQGLQRVFLTHGEPDRAGLLADRLRAEHPDWKIEIPVRDQVY